MKKAGDSLPESNVAIFSERGMNDFINRGVSLNILSLVLLSNKDFSSPPALLRNLALMVTRSNNPVSQMEKEAGLGMAIAQVGILPNPSKEFLSNFANGKLVLPTMIGFYASSETVKGINPDEGNAVKVSQDK